MFYLFFNDTATTEIYTLSLHDALPIFEVRHQRVLLPGGVPGVEHVRRGPARGVRRSAVHREVAGLLDGLHRLVTGDEVEVDRKSTRLNSSHANISYAVFCLKKKKTTTV